MALDPKKALLAKSRKLAAEIERYAAFGYVTSIDSYEQDDKSLYRRIDGLYDSASKVGLRDDPELMGYRDSLRAAMREARARASESRKSLREGRSRAAGRRSSVPAGMKGYLDEIKVSRAKGKL